MWTSQRPAVGSSNWLDTKSMHDRSSGTICQYETQKRPCENGCINQSEQERGDLGLVRCCDTTGGAPQNPNATDRDQRAYKEAYSSANDADSPPDHDAAGDGGNKSNRRQ